MGPVAKAVFHSLERLEERDGFVDDGGAHHAGELAQHALRSPVGDADQPLVGGGDDLVDRIVEQPGEELRRLEERQGVASGGRVDDDEIPLPAAGELRELFDRHVVLGAREGAADVLVEAVAEDAIGLRVVVGVPADDLAERRLGVEHERRKGAVPRPVDHGGGVRQFADAERVGETFCRVDRHHTGAAPGGRGGEGGGGRRRGLADATRAATDHDLALGEKLGEACHSSPSSGSASMAAVSTVASSAISPGPIDEQKRCGRRI